MRQTNFVEIPSGWFRIASSRALSRKRALSVGCFEDTLTLSRGLGGVDAMLGTRRLAVVEHAGEVFVFYTHRERGTPWELAIPPILADNVEMAETEFTLPLPASFYEPKENSVDFAHFPIVHQSGADAAMANYEVRDWKVDFPTLTFQMRMTHKLFGSNRFGRGIPFSFDFHFAGPGLDQVTIDGPIRFTQLSMGIPITKKTALYTYRIYVKKSGSRVFDALKLTAARRSVLHQLGKDVEIWRYKKFNERPILSAADGPIMKFRRYYAEFYA